MRVKDPGQLKRWRKRRGFSQRDLAYLAKCSQNSISLLEKGEMLTLSDDLALSIAERLQVPWEDLFEARDHAGVRRVAHGETVGRQDIPA
ncbi:MAG: hypothetical protein JWO46_2450 [Nocardioidaceae bacterium]|nr:hypothetical protein [Nocardioidaceae bacterium]